MPRQQAISIENNFIGGLKTENNPLSFPENACTDTENCIFGITGEVTRRPGIDFEANKATYATNTQEMSFSSYLWKNAGGDGNTQIYVVQTGFQLLFYLASNATEAFPLSAQKLISFVNFDIYRPSGSAANLLLEECQFADGNGYLFVFHPDAEPFFCTYSGGLVTSQTISVQIRDFTGVVDGLPVTQRPGSLSIDHQYNLSNQGWTAGTEWIATDNTTTTPVSVGIHTFTIAAGLPIVNGDNVQIFAIVTTYGTPQDPNVPIMTGSVTNYVGTTLTVSVYSILPNVVGNAVGSVHPFTISPTNNGYINTWLADIGNYPSNADVWWKFKNASGAFDPATTISQVTLGSGSAPKGHYILNAFTQQRALLAGIAGLTDVVTVKRPRTGTWFQGRLWIAGVDASQAASGDALHYSWSENIYFSQVVENTSQLGLMYQVNDPTSQDFFDLLPTDGGLIRIQGCGSIYRLFPVQNGLLVFAANGIWFITGSQGIGFSANDYTITKISAVQSISGSSFVNVLGWPTFWNEEGIYSVTPSQQGGGLTVDNICLGTILSFYSQIPAISKKYARGDYNPIEYRLSWVYRSENESNLTSRYEFDKSLNLNTTSKAFYPYSLPFGDPFIIDVKYIPGQGGSGGSHSVFKYTTVLSGNTQLSFAEERDTTDWRDFVTSGNLPYTSYFVTGYKIHGQAIRKWQPTYINMFSLGEEATFYNLQGIWDFASSGNSGRYSSIQQVTNALSNFGVVYRRHKIRGSGLALQFKITSVDTRPFSLIGWSSNESANAGV